VICILDAIWLMPMLYMQVTKPTLDDSLGIGEFLCTVVLGVTMSSLALPLLWSSNDK
jgi:hypothetical protein